MADMKRSEKENLNEENLTEQEEVEEEILAPQRDDSISKFQFYIQKYRTYVISISIGLIALIAIFIYVRYNNEANDKKAVLALSRVLPYFNAKYYDAALKGDPKAKVRGDEVLGLEYIADEYSGRPAGKVAALYAGECFIALGKPAEAKRFYEIASGSDSRLVVSGANAALGALAETENNFESAAKYYTEAAALSLDDAAKSRYKYFSGLAYEKLGNKEKAESLYREIIGETQYSEFTLHAKSGLIRIGTIIE
ncbi:MAG: hypothetical protein HW421_36 [Ignavibacteria bacterium]|nr:hypothetical protein [Ignavibacteria bacterium]